VTVSLDRVQARAFHDPKVRAFLDERNVAEIISEYGQPERVVLYSRPLPSRKPSLATDDPAVAQAMGRCAVARLPEDWRLVPFRHESCAWCEYPVAELVKACEWAEYMSRYVTAQILVWRNADGDTYERDGGAAHYENPAWAAFWALSVHDREQRIGAAS
jgi:hypothetical protein